MSMTTKDLKTAYKIIDAFRASTLKTNRFALALDSIDWADRFDADGEHYFITHGGDIFTTHTLDPFEITSERPAVFTFIETFENVDVFGRWN